MRTHIPKPTTVVGAIVAATAVGFVTSLVMKRLQKPQLPEEQDLELQLDTDRFDSEGGAMLPVSPQMS